MGRLAFYCTPGFKTAQSIDSGILTFGTCTPGLHLCDLVDIQGMTNLLGLRLYFPFSE